MVSTNGLPGHRYPTADFLRAQCGFAKEAIEAATKACPAFGENDKATMRALVPRIEPKYLKMVQLLQTPQFVKALEAARRDAAIIQRL